MVRAEQTVVLWYWVHVQVTWAGASDFPLTRQ
jgi:hypothetical protein